ncbi:TPA: VCBS domain-containing protein, partial [Aeromonas hydrophila]
GTAHTITVTLTGANDSAVISGTDTGDVSEDVGVDRGGHIATSGVLAVSDADAGEAAFAAQGGASAQGYGVFALGPHGQWTYSADNTNPAIQALKAGDSLTDSFTVHCADGTTHTVSITIHGTNDAPAIGATRASARFISEDAASTTITGLLHSRDIDSGDTLTWTVSGQGQGTYGHLDFDPVSGNWTYRIDNADADTNALVAGQRGEDVFQITATDGSGASASTVVRILVTGANDGAVIAGVDSATLTEDQTSGSTSLTANGQLSVTDVDTGEAVFQAQTGIVGQYGSFAVTADGAWSYSADNTQSAIQQLKAGDTLTDSFTVHSADGTAHTVTVTIAGSNDAPVLTAQTQAVTEDGTLLTGQMVVTDVDAGDALTFSLANAVDGFTLNADGSYSFDPSHASYQQLALGQTQDLIIPITVTDSAGATSTQNLTITVTGSNDGAVITGHDFRELQEDVSVQPGNRLAVDGVLTITDPDAGEAHFIAQADVLGSGGFGHFSIDTDGQWHYEADNSQSAIQSLRPGDARLIDSLVVTSVDGTPHTLSVSIQGMDDAPVLTAQTQAVTEDGTLLTGQMVATDVDTSDTLTFSLANAVDGFTLNADGSYRFDPSHTSYQHLAAGQTQDLIIPITVTDIAGATSTQNLTITLTGSNDGPMVTHGTASTAADLGTINEDTPRVFSEADLLRLVGASDVDDGAQLHIVAGSLTSAHGTFTGDSAHGYTFTPAANFSGQDVDLKFSVTDSTVSREAFASLDITPVADAPDRLAGKPLADNFDSAGGTGGWRTNSGAPIHLEASTLGGQGALLLHGQSAGVLHQDFDTFAGQRLQVTFDLSAADGRPSSQLEVVWEGKVIATLGTSFQLHDWSHHVLDLVASGPGSRLEFRPANADRATGVKLDNIGLSFVDVRAHREAIANHDAQLHLEKEFVLTDTDGSESLHYLIKGLPVGFTLSDGTHSVTVAQADQAIDTRGWQQDALRVQAPQDYTGAVDIQVTARSEEAGNQQTADAPLLPMRLNFESADVLRVVEDTAKTFSGDKLLALAGLVAAPGQQLSLSDVQVDAALGHFSHNSDGSWTFSPAANVSADQVPVTLTASGGAQPLTASLSLAITPVADAPVGGLTVNTDFDHQAVGSDGWAFVDGAGLGWHTDYAKGIEVGQDKLYGGTSSTNQIVELVANGGSNIYRDLPTTAGQALHFGFDLSARAGNTVATLEVVWEGKVIDTIKPGSAFGLVHHDYDLVATGANSRIELRATGGDGRSIIDNIAISAPPQVALVNHALHLALGQSFQLADTDGSEIISYLIHGLPVGFTLSDGSHSITVTTAGQVIDTAGWQIDAVRLEAPKDFEGQLDLKISARSEEGATHETATSAELPLPLRFERLITAEDTPRSFSERELLQLAGVVPAAGEHLSISAVQVDPAFGLLTHNSDGSWTFTPAANVSADQVALNITVSGGAQPQQVSLPLQITAITDAPLLGAGVSRSDFELERVTDSSGSQFFDPNKYGWHSDGAGGVEVGPETSFGGSRSGNQVLELISKGASGAKVPNLYRDLTTEHGQALHFAFDLSRRAGWAVGPVEVLWEGKVIDTITPTDSGFALHHHAYDLVATGTSARLELRVPGDTVDQRAVLDNLYIGPPPQLALVNHELHLKLGDFFNLADTDGSESLSYLIKGLPVGFTLSDGSHSVTVTAADQVIDTQGWQQSALSVQAPKDFAGTLDLSISGRSEEVSTHQTATSAELPLRLSFESLATNEDTPLTLSESKLLALSGMVPGAGEHLILSDVQVDPALGQFNHNADGSWTFIPAANVNADQVPFTLTVSGGSQPLSAALQLRITPVNDAPVLAAQMQAVTEDGTVLHGQLSAADVDAGDTLHYSLAHAVDGFTLTADGSYSFDPSHAAYQHLAGGQTQDLVIPVTVTDGAGAASTQNLTITVTGTDDGLQVAHATAATAADLGAINEDTPRVFTEAELLQAVGASNVDDGTQLHIVAGSLTSPHGSFSGDAAHGYTFTPAANFSGQDVDLQFSVTDGTVSREAHAQLDITPVADAPVRSGGFSITTDFNSVDVGAVGWKLSDPSPLGWHSSEASGVEIGQERLYGGSGNNQILSLTASWSSNIYRDLATQAGQTVHVGFDLSARPGFAMTPVEVLWEGKVIDTISPTAGTYAMQHHGYDLVATGSNSRLEFRATGQGEARALFDNIQIGTPDHLTLGKQDVLLKPYLGYELADTDGSETLSYEVHGLPVGFTLTDGSHSVTVATAGQVIETRGWSQDALAVRAPQDFQGDVSIQVSARSEEGGTHQTASAADLTLHLSDSHVAVISGESTITLTEDQHVNAQGKLEHVGKLTINDPDVGEAKFQPQNAVGTTYGSYTIGQDGNWIYQANNSQEAIQKLKTGEHLTDSFTVHSADGTAHTINVTIQGQDDAPAFVPHAGPTRSDDVYSQIGQAFESMIHQNFKYLGDMMLHGADTYPFERALVIIKNAGVSFIAPDGSVAQAFAPHGTLTEVPIAEMIAWHAKGAGYQVVFTDAKASEIGVYAHNSGNPGMLSGRGSYSDWVLHPEQSAAQLTPVMHDVASASNGAAVQGAAVMPPAIAPLEFDSAHVLEDNGQQIAGFIEVKDADAGQSSMQPQTGTATHYGRFSIDVNGDWVYQLDTLRPEVQQLTDGQTLVDTITVHSADGTAHEVNITIHGQNDGAVIAGTDSGTVVEDHHVTAAGTLVAQGQLTVTDADAGQAAFVAQNDIATQYGHFSLAANGHWTYTVDNTRADIQALQPGGTPGETADVSQALAQALAQSQEVGFQAVAQALTQGQPRAVASVLDLSIQGAAIVLSSPVGTAPVVYAMDGNGRSTIGVDELLSWLHQGKGYELHLQGSQSDVQVFVHDRGDAADLHALPQSAAADLADPAGSAQHLALSWHTAPLPAELGETVTVRSVDGTEHRINLSIFGTAENAVIAGIDTGSVTEDTHVTGAGMIQTHGKLSIQDPNAGQAAFTAVHQVAGQYGQLSLEADGQWTYTADNNSAALNALGKGQSAVETFVVKSVDGTAHSINITVNGADETYNVWNSLIRVAMSRREYQPLADAMRAGNADALDMVKVSFGSAQPHLLDASGHEVPVPHVTHTGMGYQVPLKDLTEWMHGHPGGQLILTGGSSTGIFFHDYYDESSFKALGQYVYSPMASYNQLQLAVPGMPQATVSHVSSTTAAQLGGADSGSVLADGDAQLQTQGHLTVLDADGGQAHFTTQQAVLGQYGSFSIDAQGSWHYEADGHAPALSQLAAGQLLSETFSVHSADGTSHTITVQLFGDNASAAVISGADSASLSEDQAVQAGQLRASGQLNITDGDAGQAHFNAQSDVVGSAGLGHFSLDTSGAWNYAVDNGNPQIQQLKAGETVTDTLTVSSADGTTHQITVTLGGSNDAAVIAGADSGTVSEDGGLSASGKLVISDVDSGQASFTPQHQAAAHGSFTLTASGDWTYTLDNQSAAVQALKTGEILSDSITVQSVDGCSHVVTVHINGANDAPVLQAQSQTVAEDGSALRGQMQASDADHDEHLQFSTSAQVAGFSLHADGSYTFDPGHADYQSLTAGQQRDIAIPVVVSDSAGDHGMQFLTLHITGRDDGAVINGVDVGQVLVGRQAQAGGQLLVSDVDAGQAGFQAGQIVGSFGSLSIDAQGHWQYQLDTSNAQVQRLGWQDRVTDSVTVHSLDGTAHDVNIQVTGSASVPLYSSVQPHSGMDAYGNILAAVHGAGYQYQGLADALDKGDSSVVANMALSISGSHVEVIDTAGNVLQTFSPVGVDYAATMSMRDLMQWHAQGFGIVVHEDSGMDATRMWLHNMGDPHNISVRLPDGTGFDGWADKWTFGELPLNAMPAPAPVIASDEQSVELTDMRPSQSAQVNIEVTPVAEHDVPQQLIPVLSDMTASDGVSTGVEINNEQQMGIAPHVADYWQFADPSGVAQGDKLDGHPFADQVSGYLDAAGIHVEEGAQVMPQMPPVEALMAQHVNGSNDEHHMTSLDESVTGSEAGEPVLAPEDPSHQHHG